MDGTTYFGRLSPLKVELWDDTEKKEQESPDYVIKVNSVEKELVQSALGIYNIETKVNKNIDLYDLKEYALAFVDSPEPSKY